MALSPLAIASRRSPIASATLIHVLEIVQRRYIVQSSAQYASSTRQLSTTVTSARTGLPLLPQQTNHARSISRPSLISRPASSAHATVEEAPHDGDHYLPLSSSPPLLPEPPSTAPRIPNHQPSFPRRGKSTADTWIRNFKSQHRTPAHLVDLQVLGKVSEIWLSSADQAAWRWLSNQLEELMTGMDRQTQDLVLRETVKALQAYASVELEDWDAAQNLLETTGDVHAGSTALKHGLRAVVLARLEQWDISLEEMGFAIKRWRKMKPGGKEHDITDLAVFRKYVQVLEDSVKWQEIFALISSKTLRNKLNRNNPELRALAETTLARVPQPILAIARFIEHGDAQRSRILVELLVSGLLSSDNTIDNGSAEVGLARRDDPVVEILQIAQEANVKLTLNHQALLVEATKPNADGEATQYDNYARGMTAYELLETFRSARMPDGPEVITKAWQQYNDTNHPVMEDYNAYASALARFGRPREVLEVLGLAYGDELETSYRAMDIIQLAYYNAHNVDGTRTYLDRMIALKRTSTPYNRLLSLYAAKADVPATLELFNTMLSENIKPDLAAFTSLLSLFANRTDPVNAENIFASMTEAGVKPDGVAFGALLNAYVEAGEWEAAASRYETVPDYLKTHPSIVTILCKAMVLLSAPTDYVLKYFRGIPNPTKYAWALVIQSATDNGDFELAKSLYEELDNRALQDPKAMKPDVYTLSILLHGYLRAGYTESAREVYDEMLRRDIIPTSVTYAMVISSFSSMTGHSSLLQAQEFAEAIYKQSREQNIYENARARGNMEENLFGPLVDVSGRETDIARAEEYFLKATAERPSVPLYTKLMDAYRRAGNVDSVMEIWGKAFQLAIEQTSLKNTPPSDETPESTPTRTRANILAVPLSIAMDALTSLDRYLDIRRIWQQTKDAGFGFDSANYNHYAVALARTGDLEGAFRVVDRVLLPRWSELKRRRNATAIRDVKGLQSVYEPENEEDAGNAAEEERSLGKPVDAALRPPNRRTEFRWDDATTNETRGDPTLNILNYWRPNDLLWRPSLLTVTVLEHAYSQLEGARRKAAWMALPGGNDEDAESEATLEDTREPEEGDEEHLDEEGRIQVVFPSFGGVPLRGEDGKPRKVSPIVFIAQLNRRYFKVVALLTLHRKRRQARLVKEKGSRYQERT